ncbi:hypothetical protein CCACVL1_25693 [Corchorus capsularis]|uniref:Uncharacterized protein n=1 Tax=Corchorus capsularis TaxID=210143 RepID=A0A1R3GI12_COCAP|nr:hypothetical protein CCACVL1_25693 [Corchorus capsularis]
MAIEWFREQDHPLIKISHKSDPLGS